jgi:hypothetical protein
MLKRLLSIFKCHDDEDAEALQGHNYYVATTGNDGNDGSFGTPWLTWKHGFETIVAGDTLYIRGGNYNLGTAPIEIYGKSGTAARRINVFAYPGEVPVLNYAAYGAHADFYAGILLSECDYWTLKGLNITGIVQLDFQTKAFWLHGGNYCQFINCNAYGNSAGGFTIQGNPGLSVCLWNSIINCDAYNNYDLWQDGQSANGFAITTMGVGSRTVLYGCRAWFCSDDGFDFWENNGIVYADRCWSFNNGRGANGDGCGFKLGLTSGVPDPYGRVITNCIAAHNVNGTAGVGFYRNAAICTMKHYNNLCYDNLEGFDFNGGTAAVIFRNNIEYHDVLPFAWGINEVHDHNSWDIPLVITDADFLSVDWTQLQGARNADNSLPVVNFGHLAVGSDCIAAGANVGIVTDGDGLPWNDPPSVGAFEIV